MSQLLLPPGMRLKSQTLPILPILQVRMARKVRVLVMDPRVMKANLTLLSQEIQRNLKIRKIQLTPLIP